MSFLDSLENNLNTLERREETGRDEGKRRDFERARALAAAPWAERLKTGEFTKQLMALSVRAGHARKMKVNLVWLDATLRLEARRQRLELRPGPGGVDIVFLNVAGQEIRRAQADLDGDPATVLREWMEEIDKARAAEAAAAARMESADPE